MPVSERVVTGQARRLLTLPFAPSKDSDEAKLLLDEFRRVLRTRVLTDAHCAAVVDYLIDHAGRCPPPIDVIEAIGQVQAPDELKGPMGCSECKGSGFVSFTKTVRLKNGMEYPGDFSRFCECALGQFKQAAEARRDAEQAAKNGAR